ncbi:unnamed protein product [Leuciscus chuanchicus]
MKNDVIQWKFGYENILIAEINKLADSITVYDDVLDGRFRDRLKLDKQTGSLTITNIRTEEMGLYTLQINSERKRQIRLLFYGVKSVSVMEGDSVTLNSHHAEIKDDDLIQWRLSVGDDEWSSEKTLIAEINKQAGSITEHDDVLDGRFRDRLKLDKQTGSLTITNTRTEHAGRYERKINIMNTEFFLSVFDEMSVMEGDSVTLNSDLTEMKNDVIRWRITVHDDVLDGRFRDRLKLGKQTGSLTITNTRTEHAGRYKLQVFSNRFSSKSFSVSVSACLSVPVISTAWPSSSSSTHPNPISNQTQHLDITLIGILYILFYYAIDSVHCCGPTEAVIRLVLSALVGVATIIIVVYDIRSRRAEPDQAHIHTSGSIEI